MNKICDNNPWFSCGCPEHTDRDRHKRHLHGHADCGMVRVRRPELLYKIANAAAIVKDSIPDEMGTHEMRKWIEDITDDHNIDRVTDLLDLAFADLLQWLDNRLSPETYEMDIDLDVRDEYTLITKKALTPTKAFRVLKPRIEEYMVAYVLWQWLLHKGFTAQAQHWLDVLADLKEKLNNLLTGNRTKRPLSPF